MNKIYMSILKNLVNPVYGLSSGEMTMAVSFNNDIMPLFNQFTGQMMWRFDLTNYDQVRANAQVIYGRINGGGMPPPPFDPLTLEQIQLFQQWMDEGYQP